VAAIVGAATTVRLTGTVCGLLPAPAAPIMTLPLYVPADNPLGSTDTLRLAGVVPEPFVTLNQAAEAVAVRLSAEPLLVTDTLCAPGKLAPIW
jgi:hypothetical protein